MTVAEFVRNMSTVMDWIESEQEDIILTRNGKPIARLVPEPPEMTALEVLGDLYRTLDDETADALAGAISSNRFRGETLRG